ncbi:MAG TPA: DUF2232 domain-containing protein [Gemmatimonadaceae bacterium]|nr:DUF2232 domain-containing protein [Gemmatimonadaceae bacterium]
MTATAQQHMPVAAPAERGWGKLILALLAFVFVPMFPPVRAFLPVEQSIYLLVPALAACWLVGWWAGGRAIFAVGWLALATWLMWQHPSTPDSFLNLVRGWSLLLAGAFGLVCLFGLRRPLFSRALTALSITLFLALAMSSMGPVSVSEARQTVAEEFVRRNAETMTQINASVAQIAAQHPQEWKELTDKVPWFHDVPARVQESLQLFSRAGLGLFPSLLALQSLLALALAWAIYHRLSRARLGAPMRPLREFRFNDQLVWGLIVGLTIIFLPTLATLHGVGRNLLVFFGALYAMRGLAVLAWFLAPGALATTITVALALLFLPIVQFVAAFVFLVLLIASFGLGLGDTWADWRHRARPTS